MGALVEVLARLSVLTREAVGATVGGGLEVLAVSLPETYMTSHLKMVVSKFGILWNSRNFQVLLLLVSGRGFGKLFGVVQEDHPFQVV